MEYTKTTDLSMELIAYSGESKALALKSIKQARQGNFNEALKTYEKSKESLLRVHRLHADIIQHEAAGKSYELNTLFIHAQDHFMSALIIGELAEIILDLYKKIEK